jgi:hypothetical protein
MIDNKDTIKKKRKKEKRKKRTFQGVKMPLEPKKNVKHYSKEL